MNLIGRIRLYIEVFLLLAKVKILDLLGLIQVKTIKARDGRSIFEICYYLNGSLYKVRFPQRRGPIDIDNIVDENNIDVTEKVFQYIGPGEPFHNLYITPNTLGFEKLIFTSLLGGGIRTFSQHEAITL